MGGLEDIYEYLRLWALLRELQHLTAAVMKGLSSSLVSDTVCSGPNPTFQGRAKGFQEKGCIKRGLRHRIIFKDFNLMRGSCRPYQAEENKFGKGQAQK